MNEKTCKKCGEIKKISDFVKDKRCKDGHTHCCNICNQKHQSKYKDKNKDNIKEYYKNYYSENNKSTLIKAKKYYNENKKNILDKRKIYRNENKNKINEYNKKYISNKKYIRTWRKLLWRCLNYFNNPKEDKTINLLGYSPIQLKEHLESLFTEGMSWNNYGEWHIDHIKPVSSFNKDTHPSIVNALSNLQPLWAEDNLKKWKN